MRDGLKVALGEMTARAIVRRPLLKTLPLRKSTALRSMAAQAFTPIVGRCFLDARFCVRAMAGDAAQSALTSLIAAAQHHRRIVLQEVLIRGRLAPIRCPENSYGIVQR